MKLFYERSTGIPTKPKAEKIPTKPPLLAATQRLGEEGWGRPPGHGQAGSKRSNQTQVVDNNQSKQFLDQNRKGGNEGRSGERAAEFNLICGHPKCFVGLD